MTRPFQPSLQLPDADGPLRREPPLSETELLQRAAALSGRHIAEVARALRVSVPADAVRAKGFVGQLIERALGADPQAGDSPDFSDLGIELKTIPIGPRGKPSESTFCCVVSLSKSDQARWEESRVRRKLRRVLWVPVEGSHVSDIGARLVGEPVLWSPSQDQAQRLIADWTDLMGGLGSGRQVTAQEGELLQIRPKAASSKNRTLGPGDGGTVSIPPVGFYLRPKFTLEIITREPRETSP